MQSLRLKLLALLTVLLVWTAACQPDLPLPTTVVSNDDIGGITVRIPDGWTVIAEPRQIAGRKGVTLAVLPADITRDQVPGDINPYPVIRVDYTARSLTPLATGTALQAVAIQQAGILAPQVAFETYEPLKISQQDAYLLRGTQVESGRNHYILVIDFVAQNGLVTVALTGLEDLTRYQEDARTIATNLVVTIKPDVSGATGVPPVEVTADPGPEGTAEVGPEATTEAQPEITAEPGPETTAEVDPAAEATVEATPPTAEAASGTEEVGADTGSVIAIPEATNTVTLMSGYSLVYPEGWHAVSNNQSVIALNLGEDVEQALLKRQVIPAGQAYILVELGSARTLFNLTDPVDLNSRLQRQIEATANYKPPLTYGPIEDVEVGRYTGAVVLATSELNDQLLVLLALDGGVYAQVRLNTAPGEADSFKEVVLQILATLQPAVA